VPTHYIIDGNNLLYATEEADHASRVGRETLVRRIERWAKRRDVAITIVFDGPTPPPGMGRQLSSQRLAVQFSRDRTADDLIVEMIESASVPTGLHIITSDRAIQHAARYRKCEVTGAREFADSLFKQADSRPPQPRESSADRPSTDDTDWYAQFDVDDEEPPFDGHGAMVGE
jgi:predicted RNA-binding protein with PIN domain